MGRWYQKDRILVADVPLQFYSRTSPEPVQFYERDDPIDYNIQYQAVGDAANANTDPNDDWTQHEETYVRQWINTCTIINMVVRVNDAPGTGKSRIFTLVKNGESTGLSVTLGATDTVGSIVTSVSFTLGDKISMAIKEINTPAKTEFSIAMTAVTSDDRQVFTNTRRFPTAWLRPYYQKCLYNWAGYWDTYSLAQKTQDDYKYNWHNLVATPGALENLYVQLDEDASTSGDSDDGWSFGVASFDAIDDPAWTSAEWFKITGTDRTGNSGYNGHSVSAGDMVSVWANALTVYANYTTDHWIHIDFVPTIAGNRTYQSTSGNSDGWKRGAVTTIGGPQADTDSFTVIPCSGIISGLCAEIRTAMQSGKTSTVTFYKNGVATDLAITADENDVFIQNTTDYFTVVAGDIIDLRCVSNQVGEHAMGNLAWVFNSGYTNVTPLFTDNWGLGKVETGATQKLPIQFYSRDV